MFGGIGDAIGGIVDKVTDVVGGIGDVAGKIGDLAGGIMNSPFGSILAAIFPGAGAALGAANVLGGLFDGLSSQVAGGEDY